MVYNDPFNDPLMTLNDPFNFPNDPLMTLQKSNITKTISFLLV